jgi:uncharacterized protein YjbJ (UPF0337 family)
LASELLGEAFDQPATDAGIGPSRIDHHLPLEFAFRWGDHDLRSASGTKCQRGRYLKIPTHSEDTAMDKDRIKGSAEQAKGAVKEAAGKVFGDKKLETEGKADKVAGKVQNAVGGLKDAVRGK